MVSITFFFLQTLRILRQTFAPGLLNLSQDREPGYEGGMEKIKAKGESKEGGKRKNETSSLISSGLV